MKKLIYFAFHRLVFFALALIAQVLVFAVMILIFAEYIQEFYWICIVISIVAAIYIVSDDGEPAYKIGWLILILPFPVFGGIFYFLVGGSGIPQKLKLEMEKGVEQSVQTLNKDFKSGDLLVLGEDAVGQAYYLEKYAFCPAYTNTEVEYYSLGEYAFESMLKECEKAEKYLFLEYFIIDHGEMWDAILNVLKRKAAQGVLVRLLYDDMGCAFTLNRNYEKQLHEFGIECQVFHRFTPTVSLRHNNRDHRKLMIIDGKTAFTGGINLADEYINKKEKYGHWKDSAICLEGDAVWSMTVNFLTMWTYCNKTEEDFELYRPSAMSIRPWTGYVQPYIDTPLDHEAVSQTVYLNMITRARKYIYITTPYLVIDATSRNALINAAKMGVDVRIITPHVPDKKAVFEVTRAHYPPLIEAGVTIYEYTPGFMHAKNFVVDGRFATVGTVNLDYRSLFLHFENGVWMCDAPCIKDIVADFKETIKVCEVVKIKRHRRLNLFLEIYRSFLRVFAPLM